MSKRSDDKYLADMVQYARDACEIAARVDAEGFQRDRAIQLALAHLVQIIGEAASRTDESTRTLLPSVPWPQIIGMRHRLVHDYGNISYAVIWEVVERDLPPLIAALEAFTPPSA